MFKLSKLRGSMTTAFGILLATLPSANSLASTGLRGAMSLSMALANATAGNSTHAESLGSGSGSGSGSGHETSHAGVIGLLGVIVTAGCCTLFLKSGCKCDCDDDDGYALI